MLPSASRTKIELAMASVTVARGASYLKLFATSTARYKSSFASARKTVARLKILTTDRLEPHAAASHEWEMNCVLTRKSFNSIRLLHRLADDLPRTHAIHTHELIRYADEQQRTIRLRAFNPINFAHCLFDQLERSLTIGVTQ